MIKNNEITKNEHFIPRFYQKLWESKESKGYVWCFNTELRNVFKTSIRYACSKNYCYEPNEQNPNNSFEKMYGKFESEFAPKYKRLINNISEICCLYKITQEDKETICKLYAHLSARHPDNVYGLKTLVITSGFTLDIEDFKEDRRTLQNIYSLGKSGIFNEFKGNFEKILNQQNIEILLSDTPNIIYTDCITNKIKTKYLPLSPYVLAKFSAKDTNADRVIRKITEKEHKEFLKEYVQNGYTTKLFASNKEILEDIKENTFKLTFYSNIKKSAGYDYNLLSDAN